MEGEVALYRRIVPAARLHRGNDTGHRSSTESGPLRLTRWRQRPPLGGADEPPVGLERDKRITEATVVDAEVTPEGRTADGVTEIGEGADDPAGERGLCAISAGRRVTLDLEVSTRRISDQPEVHRLGGRGRAVLEGEHEAIAAADEVGIGVTPSVQIAAAAEGLTEVNADALAHVVDEHDGDAKLALEPTQEAEQGRDIRAAVLIDAVEPDERIEDEQPRTVGVDHVGEALLIVSEVEAQGRGGDDMQVERGEGQAPVSSDARDALTDGGQGVLGEIDDGPPGLADREAAEGGGGRGDADGEVEGEPRLTVLGCAADDANGLMPPGRR